MSRLSRSRRSMLAASLVGAICIAVGGTQGGLATMVPVAPPPPGAPDQPCRAGTGEVAGYRLSPGTTLAKSIEPPLAGHRGDPERGVRWAVSPQHGHCIACHEIPLLKERITPDQPDSKRRFGYHGTVAPPLEGVAARFSEGELRLLIVDPRAVLPTAIKPAYHSLDGLHGVAPACAARPVLSAPQVEDIVAFLKTLK